MTVDLTPAELKARLKALGLFGLIACFEQIADKPWLREVLAVEERERQKRGLERRLRHARIGAFKPMVDFDWKWPKKVDREAIDELSLSVSSRAATTPCSWGPTALVRP